MKPQHDEPITIDLDDPTPRGVRIIAVVVGMALIAIIIAPFLLNTTIVRDEVDTSRTPGPMSNQQICQPSVSLPAVLDPLTHFAVPSWMRLCDWFTEPGNPPIDRPPRN